jgi:cell division septation protein DedD
VVHLPAADLADLDPDQIVDRALGQVSDDMAFAAVPALAAGRSSAMTAPPGAPPQAAPAAAASPTPAPEAAAGKTAETAAAEHAPTHQVLAPPPNVRPSSVFAIELAFFLDADAASGFAAALGRNGITTRLVEQLDEAGRNWIYVRSPVFTDSVAALAYGETLERKFGLPALLVSEPPAAPQPALAASGK